MLSAGCRSNREAPSVDDTYLDIPQVVRVDRVVRDQGPLTAMPRAVIYRTNGDYNDLVTVTLDASRSSLVSYPAPTDVTVASAPLIMTGGWLLDRRGGIGPNSAFLDWTYAEYSRLSATPSPSEILDHVIPDARVTAVRRLPIAATEAMTDTVWVNDYIRQLAGGQ